VAAAALDVLAATVDTTGLRRPAVVFNAAPFRRREIVDAGGRLRLVAVPPLGWTAIDTAAEDSGAAAPVTVGEGWMANGHLRLEWNADGVLTRVVDVDCARDVLVEGRGGNLFQLHEDRPRYWDAWDVDRDYLAAVTDLAGDALTGPVEITVAEAGGLRGAVRFRRSFGASTIDQTMVLAAGSRRLDFVTDVDWHEDHKFLKVAFPVAVHAASARFEIQFGHLARPTHANTAYEQARFEVCAQRWADVSEAGYGVALLNDCKYGYDVQPLAGPRSPGQVLRLSLLRAPTAPDPRCDRGRHRFTYALLPHAGDLTAVIAAGYALGSPLIVRTSGPLAEPRSRPTRPAQHSLVTVEDPGFVVETVKPADDGHGVVIRGYEALGGRRQVRLRPGVPCRAAVRTDLLERGGETVPLQPDGTLHFTVRPFELVTLRILP
jgi:alpha-mannosidase